MKILIEFVSIKSAYLHIFTYNYMHICFICKIYVRTHVLIRIEQNNSLYRASVKAACNLSIHFSNRMIPKSNFSYNFQRKNAIKCNYYDECQHINGLSNWLYVCKLNVNWQCCGSPFILTTATYTTEVPNLHIIFEIKFQFNIWLHVRGTHIMQTFFIIEWPRVQ